MSGLPTLYKCRGIPVKSPICAICLDRTRGKTLLRELTHGVRVSLCAGHHSVDFMRRNAGRDFAVTLSRTWQAQGCLTRARSRALDAHLRAVRTLGARMARARPGPTRGRSCAVRQRNASRAAMASSPPSCDCASATRRTTPPSPASGRCGAGSARVAGSGCRRRPRASAPPDGGARQASSLSSQLPAKRPASLAGSRCSMWPQPTISTYTAWPPRA